MRSRRTGETASIFLPSVPSLLQLASELEAQRNHVLGQPHRESGDDPLTGDPATRTQTEPGETGFTALGADAELDQVIFDGSSFGTATPAEATRRPTTSASRGCSTPSRCAPCCTAAKTSSCKGGPASARDRASRTRPAGYHPLPAARAAPRAQQPGGDRSSPHRQATRLDP
ncbi:hypothetical protein I546_7248 [Mycobacterium kansasii 732]|nr:hypothetical protein I546_7248 [Mycobacterium kansasii 732]